MAGTVITRKGLQLIAKLVASGTALSFTRASVGTGSVPAGYDPAGMTDLNNYKMDGSISSCSYLGDEASIIMQISSLGVETGFTITETGLFATDPDEGEILYSYLDLSKDPQYVYEENSAISKFVEMTLVVKIGTVDKVTAYFNPRSLLTREGDISGTVVEMLESIADKFPLPAAGEKSRVFFGKMKKCLSDLVTFASSEITNAEIDDLDELVFIPAFKMSDVITGGSNSLHPAFIVNGKPIAGFYISKYQNVIKDGIAYSLYGKDPEVSISFDNARTACEAKGKGYHLCTMAEWAAIAIWCKKNEFMPYGNNGYGKDSRETDYVATPTSQDGSKTGRVATGTGPLTWSHDETTNGVWDMNGNVAEWVGGHRTVVGEVQILANNDAADPNNSQSATSQSWKAIDATTGALVTPGTAGTVKLDYDVNSYWRYVTNITNSNDSIRSCLLQRVTYESDVKQPALDILRALSILPIYWDANYDGDKLWVNNKSSERITIRGGNWKVIETAGIFYSMGAARLATNPDVGFRFCYIPELS